MAENSQGVLESLLPQREGMIMDLVEEAGIDVSPWKVRKDGLAVQNPRANPNYCYEWAFGGNGEPTALCVWHSSLGNPDGPVFYEDSLRAHALKLDLIAIDRTNPPHVKSRARDQGKRARNFDSLLQRAFRTSKSIRVVILTGEPRSMAELGWDTSKVKYRRLDSELWYAHFYRDDDGSFRLVRGIPLEVLTQDKDEVEPKAIFVDQFSLPEPPEKRDSTGSTFVRSQEVRRNVLARAQGICECCGLHGFRTLNETIYLETHHVISLSENGPDIEWNVVAICPNDHRRAHCAEDRLAIRDELIAKLVKRYPNARPNLAALLELSDARS